MSPGSRHLNDVTGHVLSFVGPPSTGKTSLGQMITRALARPFQRIVIDSLVLGGMCDETPICGAARGSRSGTKCSLQSAFLRTPRFQPFCFLIWMITS